MGNWYEEKPTIHGAVACITNNLHLAAKISAFFTEEGYYFPVIDPPRLGRPDATNEIIRRINLFARLQPEVILLAGLSDQEKMAFLNYVPIEKLQNISDEQDIEVLMDSLKSEKQLIGEILCREDQVAIGLLLAKYQNKYIKIDNSSPDLDENDLDKFVSSDHLVVIDDISGINQVIAANYAYMLKGRIKILQQPSEDENSLIYQDIQDSENLIDKVRGEIAERSLMSHQFKLDEKMKPENIKEKFVTFITSGFPYGYFFPDTPSTHLFSYPDLGLSVLNGLMGGYAPTDIALTVDPGHFDKSETNDVNNALQKIGTYVRCLKNREATVYKFGQFLDVYPYDLLYICSHAGKSDGQEFEIEVPDENGSAHSITIEVADAFGLMEDYRGGETQVEVKSTYHVVSIDGYDWSDQEHPKPKGVMKNFHENIDRSKWKILCKRNIPKVRRTVVLKMKDGEFIPMQHNVAGHKSPFIFNNACLTFDEFSGLFIFAGARAYVGTLVSIGHEYAIKLAQEFFNNLNPDVSVPVQLWEAQKRLDVTGNKKYYYLHVGVFHTFIRPAIHGTTQEVRDEISSGIVNYKKKKEAKPEFGRKMDAYAELLSQELKDMDEKFIQSK